MMGACSLFATASSRQSRPGSEADLRPPGVLVSFAAPRISASSAVLAVELRKSIRRSKKVPTGGESRTLDQRTHEIIYVGAFDRSLIGKHMLEVAATGEASEAAGYAAIVVKALKARARRSRPAGSATSDTNTEGSRSREHQTG